ncbi:MAG: ion transporter [Bacteroidetes bacterium]|nr:ion transporter [Bacteroidota bacterium]
MIKKLFLNDKFILGLILLNTIVIFLGGYVVSQYDKFLFSIVDNSITSLFILELFVKLKSFGFRQYFKSNWNRLDFLLIIISIPALITFTFNLTTIDISYLLVFRVLRVFKAFRFLKFIPNVNQLVAGIQRALKTSVFVLIGFATYIFIIGVLSFYLFNSSGSDYFKSPMISLYSIFKIFTVEGWFEIPEQIIVNYSTISSFFIYLYFIIVVLTGGILGLSLVNSIFVDSMVSDNNDELEKKIDNLDKKVTQLLNKISEDETRKNIR